MADGTSGGATLSHRPERTPVFLIAALVMALTGGATVGAQERPDGARPPALPEVVITASGFEQARKDAPASITVITRDQLQRQRTTSLAEALRDVEGIDVGGTAGKTGGVSISLRGMPSDYTLVLIDGRRQNSSGNVAPNGFGETSTSFLPPTSAIERVEIIRGPMATLYGSDAMGGVINIITRRVRSSWAGTLGTDATVQEEGGFGNTYGGNLYLNGPLVADRLGLAVRGSAFQREQASLTPTGEFADGTAISARGPSPVRADMYDIGGRLTLTPGRAHDIWLDADISRQRYDNARAQLGTLDDPTGDPPSFNGYGPRLRFEREQLAVGHNWRFRSGVVETSLMRNATSTIGRTLPTGTPGGPPGSGAPDKPAGTPRALEATSTVLDSKLTTAVAQHVLSVGGQLWDAGMEDGIALTPFDYVQWALFVEDEWRFAAPLALTVGVRRDDHSAFGGQFSPRAYLVWTATPEWTVKGGVSRGYKTPRVEQLVDGIIGFTAQGRTATIGSPTLRPETSTSTELGVYFGGQRGLSANVTLFNNDFRDKITTGTPVANCTFAGAPDRAGCVNHGSFPTQESFAQSVNVDEAVTRGVETSATIPLGRAMSLLANYTFTHSEQRSGINAGMPLMNTPAHMVNGSLRVRPAARVDGWLRGEYRSARARRTTIADDPAYDALGDYRAYSLLHLGGSVDVGRGVTFNATIYNLLNTDFLRYAAYQGAPTSANPGGMQYTNVYNNHQEGRRLWVSTSVAF
jgi:outer membrane receptor for ferrienterochelin and colicins